MYEELKLKEAVYFYSGMVSGTDNHQSLVHELSAFLSAARSVLQYAREEATTRGGQQWYDNHMISSKVLAFFKDKRDISVHTQPVQVNQHISIQLTCIMPPSPSLRIEVFDQTGQLIDEYSSKPSEPPPAPESPSKVTHGFIFPDWPGNEDVLQLCHLYLNELQRVVEDGQNNGFLTK